GAKLQYRLESLPLREALRVHPAELLTAGMRLPLGLLLGGLLACLWCVVLGAPWRETGDALAVTFSVLIPIGRVGCLLYGCCMGAVCGRWPRAFCVSYPPGTEAYTQQLRDNLISLSSRLSLPAHPLPLYFALASLFTLAVLLWLLRRGAPPGA